MGSNPVKDKSMFPRARNFTLIVNVQYWLVSKTDSREFLFANSILHNRTKINSV